MTQNRKGYIRGKHWSSDSSLRIAPGCTFQSLTFLLDLLLSSLCFLHLLLFWTFSRDQQLNTNGWISMIFEAKLPDVSEVDIFGILMLIDCPFLTWDLISTLISCQAAQPHDANAQSQLHLMTTKEKQLVTFLEMVMSQNYGTQWRNNWYIWPMGGKSFIFGAWSFLNPFALILNLFFLRHTSIPSYIYIHICHTFCVDLPFLSIS